MSDSIANTVQTALAMQQQQVMQQKNAMMLRKVLDTQAGAVASLIEGVSSNAAAQPQLATSGTVGTQLHTTA